VKVRPREKEVEIGDSSPFPLFAPVTSEISCIWCFAVKNSCCFGFRVSNFDFLLCALRDSPRPLRLCVSPLFAAYDNQPDKQRPIKKQKLFTRISWISTDCNPAQPVRENPCHPCQMPFPACALVRCCSFSGARVSHLQHIARQPRMNTKEHECLTAKYAKYTKFLK
jgi:hypothetical protein